jgi:hypothetical protein
VQSILAGKIQANLIAVGIAASRFTPPPGLVEWPTFKPNAASLERCHAAIQVITFKVNNNSGSDQVCRFNRECGVTLRANEAGVIRRGNNLPKSKAQVKSVERTMSVAGTVTWFKRMLHYSKF